MCLKHAFRRLFVCFSLLLIFKLFKQCHGSLCGLTDMRNALVRVGMMKFSTSFYKILKTQNVTKISFLTTTQNSCLLITQCLYFTLKLQKLQDVWRGLTGQFLNSSLFVTASSVTQVVRTCWNQLFNFGIYRIVTMTPLL